MSTFIDGEDAEAPQTTNDNVDTIQGESVATPATVVATPEEPKTEDAAA